jgi:F0F1-type ATP synthase assembly protein I
VAPKDQGSSNSPGDFARQLAQATEYPLILVGSTVGGGFVGYLLDRSLHTKPYLLLAVGALGFIVGLRDMLRRIAKSDPSSTDSR